MTPLNCCYCPCFSPGYWSVTSQLTVSLLTATKQPTQWHKAPYWEKMLLNMILKCKHFELNLCQVAKHCSSQLDSRPPPISKVKAESSDDSLHAFSTNTSVMPMRDTLKRQHEVTSCTMLLATQSESHPTWVITKPCYTSPQTSQRKHRHTQNMLFDKSQWSVMRKAFCHL